MFDEEMKTKYQELTPSPNLRERVVSEEFASCPHRKRGGAGPWMAAACLALLVLAAALPLLPRNRGEMSLLYNGGPVGSEPVSVSGEGPIPRDLPPPSLYAGPSQSPPLIRFTVETEGQAALIPQRGTVSVRQGDGLITSQDSLTLTGGSRVEWDVTELLPGETAQLTLVAGDQTKTYLLSYLEEGESWALQETSSSQ